MALVKLFGNLRDHVQAPQLAAPGRTVGEVLTWLCATNPSLQNALFDEGGLRPHVRIMVNGHDVELARGLDTPLDEADQLAIFPPIAGG